MSDRNVVQALGDVMRDVQGVAKRDRNQAQGFNFRGIDAVVNAVGPALRNHGVVVLPQVIDYSYDTVEIGKNRTQMALVRVKVAYAFYGPAGDSLKAISVGEAMDSGDKATAKAMSVAFRTALLQSLCLPTDEPDPDAVTYQRSVAADAELIARAEAAISGAETEEKLTSIAAWLGRQPFDEAQAERFNILIDRKRIELEEPT